MTLPIDVSQLSDDDIGEERATLNMDHEEAIEYVREICVEEGFGVPVEFSPSELLNSKVDANRDPLYVLGACSPEMADRALDETIGIATLFPCNFIISQREPGLQEVQHVSIMKIARLVGLAPDNNAWEAIVTDTGELVDAAFTRFRQEPSPP